jgi:arginine/serine-rich splicing factor 1/9
MAKVFIGNLSEDVQEKDLEEKFSKFGKISSLILKLPPRPPAFAFIVRSPVFFF